MKKLSEIERIKNLEEVVFYLIYFLLFGWMLSDFTKQILVPFISAFGYGLFIILMFIPAPLFYFRLLQTFIVIQTNALDSLGEKYLFLVKPLIKIIMTYMSPIKYFFWFLGIFIALALTNFDTSKIGATILGILLANIPLRRGSKRKK